MPYRIEVYNTFTYTSVADKKKLTVAIEKFKLYCNPRKNVVFDRYIFWKTIQKEGETVDQFVTSLKQKISSCKYLLAMADDMVRDKLVFGIRDIHLKERLLCEQDLDLTKARNICHASEQSKIQIKEMNVTSSGSGTVNKIRSKSSHIPVRKNKVQKQSSGAQQLQKSQ